MKQFYNVFSNEKSVATCDTINIEKVSTVWTQLTRSHLRLLFNPEINSMNYYDEKKNC